MISSSQLLLVSATIMNFALHYLCQTNPYVAAIQFCQETQNTNNNNSTSDDHRS